MANGVLVCRGGDCQCAADKIHACAATLYAKNQEQVGKFIICYFGSKDAKKVNHDKRFRVFYTRNLSSTIISFLRNRLSSKI